MPHDDTAAPADDAARPTPELDIARKIWLAGVGAYDRISAEAQGVVEKLASSASETFDDLVAKGEEVEDRVRKSLAASPRAEKMNQAMESAAAKAAEQRATLEARLSKVRETVSETLAPWNLPALGQAVEKLSAKVDALGQEVAALRAETAEKADKAPTAD
jgi:poly(hydroxyalkanoate) granule-associated protein